MASVDLVASTVLDASASLMNDTAKVTYNYVAMMPYLRLAMNELQEHYQLNSIPATQLTSAVIQVDAGNTEIIFNGVGVPSLPNDLIEPQQLWERLRNTNPFSPMTRKDYLPPEVNLVSRFGIYAWNNQSIQLLKSDQNNDIKIDYTKELFTQLVDENSIINVINARTFLEYRTAALCSEFIERNSTSAKALNDYAIIAIDRATGIGVKGKQAIQTRRRPFRSGYKRRGC